MVFPTPTAHFFCTYLRKRSPLLIGKSRRLLKRAIWNTANTRGKYHWNRDLSRQSLSIQYNIVAGRERPLFSQLLRNDRDCCGAHTSSSLRAASHISLYAYTWYPQMQQDVSNSSMLHASLSWSLAFVSRLKVLRQFFVPYVHLYENFSTRNINTWKFCNAKYFQTMVICWPSTLLHIRVHFKKAWSHL